MYGKIKKEYKILVGKVTTQKT